MFLKNLVTLASVVMFGTALGLVGCDDGDLPEGKTQVDENPGQTAVFESSPALASEPAMAPVSADPVNVKVESSETTPLDQVFDLVYHDSTLYAAYSDGIVIYDFRTRAAEKIGFGRVFRSLAYYDGKLYAGGDGLFTVEGKSLAPAEGSFPGSIRALYTDSFRLLIGTDQGLFSKSPFSEEKLMDKASVAALQFDRDGLWVGTVGQGLFRWDGNDFQKRFLRRDICLFDFVNDMAYAHGYLYVAAETGFFIFDGGKWTPWTMAEGMPSDKVWDIEPAGYKVYMATDAGVVYYYDGTLYPVEKLEDISATALAISGRKVFVGSADGNILMKTGDVLTTLYAENTLAEEEEVPNGDSVETFVEESEALSQAETEVLEELEE